MAKALKRQGKSARQEAVDLFAYQWQVRGLPKVVRELKFAKEVGRGWKFDFATQIKKPSGRVWRLAIEIEGIVMRQDEHGVWQMGGRHATISGYKEDCIKYATAMMLGWNVLRFEQSQVKSRYAIETVTRILSRFGWKAKS